MVLERRRRIVMTGRGFRGLRVLSGMGRRSSWKKLCGDVRDYCPVMTGAEQQVVSQLVVGAAAALDLLRSRHNLTLMVQH